MKPPAQPGTHFTRKDSAASLPSDQRTPTPNVPLRAAELPWDHWSEGTRFGGADVPLGKLGGCTQIGFNLMELPPGKQSCPFHWHQREEEHFYVLAGRCVLRSGDARHEMGPGDYVGFPAGTGVAHAFENPFDEPCRLVAVGSKDPDEIAVYPDSGKMKLRALGQIVPLPENSLDYWQGERPDEPI